MHFKKPITTLVNLSLAFLFCIQLSATEVEELAKEIRTRFGISHSEPNLLQNLVALAKATRAEHTRLIQASFTANNKKSKELIQSKKVEASAEHEAMSQVLEKFSPAFFLKNPSKEDLIEFIRASGRVPDFAKLREHGITKFGSDYNALNPLGATTSKRLQDAINDAVELLTSNHVTTVDDACELMKDIPPGSLEKFTKAVEAKLSTTPEEKKIMFRQQRHVSLYYLHPDIWALELSTIRPNPKGHLDSQGFRNFVLSGEPKDVLSELHSRYLEASKEKTPEKQNELSTLEHHLQELFKRAPSLSVELRKKQGYFPAFTSLFSADKMCWRQIKNLYDRQKPSQAK